MLVQFLLTLPLTFMVLNSVVSYIASSTHWVCLFHICAVQSIDFQIGDIFLYHVIFTDRLLLLHPRHVFFVSSVSYASSDDVFAHLWSLILAVGKAAAL